MAYPWPLRSSSQLPHTRLSILLTGHTQPAKGNKTTEAHAVQAPTKLLQHLIIPTTMGYSSRGKGVSLGTSRESTHFYFWQWNYTVLHSLEERHQCVYQHSLGSKVYLNNHTTCAVVFSSMPAKNYHIPMWSHSSQMLKTWEFKVAQDGCGLLDAKHRVGDVTPTDLMCYHMISQRHQTVWSFTFPCACCKLTTGHYWHWSCLQDEMACHRVVVRCYPSKIVLNHQTLSRFSLC